MKKNTIVKRLIAILLVLVMAATLLPPQEANAYFTVTDALDAVFLAIDTQACFVDTPGWDTCGSWALDVLFMALPLVPNLFRKTATRSFQIADKSFDSAEDYLKFIKTLDSADDYKKYGIVAFTEEEAMKGVGIIGPYKELKRSVKSLNGQIEIHHILPQSIAKQLGYTDSQLDEILSIPLSKAAHTGKGNKITTALNRISNKFKAMRGSTFNLALADVPLLLGDIAYNFKAFPKLKKVAMMQVICSPLGQKWIEQSGSALLYNKFCLTEHDYAGDVWAYDPEVYLAKAGYSMSYLEAQYEAAPDTNYRSFEYNGHTYQIVNQNTTYQEATKIAEQYGAHLVTLNSYDENMFLANILKQTELSWNMNSYWIGGMYQNNGYCWYDGEAVPWNLRWMEDESAHGNTEPFLQILGKRYGLYSDYYGNTQAKGQVGQVVTVMADGSAYHANETASDFFGKKMNGYILEYDHGTQSQTPSSLPGSSWDSTPQVRTVSGHHYNRAGYDKGTYSGSWDTRPQGYGTLIYDSDNGYMISVSGTVYHAAKYEGNWVDGRRVGQGSLTFGNGARYDGTWNTGGLYFDGYYISGSFRYRVKQTILSDGVTIRSQWIGDWERITDNPANSTSNSTPKVTDRYYNRGGFNFDKGLYTGEWSTCPNGYGTLVYDGDTGYSITTTSGKTYLATKYTGQWVNGKRCGQGVLTFANGASFDGTWNTNGLYFYGYYVSGSYKRLVKQTVSADGLTIHSDWLGSWERI